jgi:DNA topoisomerase II
MTDLATKYQKKSDKQHVLDNPDTYTGSMELTEYNTYVFDDVSKCILSKELNIIPGLYKLFDEGAVNCRDHHVRQEQAISNGLTDSFPVTRIEFTISEDGVITMYNDGNGIDVAKHPDYGVWIPELIFGHLRTSTNYDKTEKKIVGGKNGFGFKLVLIWSSWGSVETVDHKRKLKYTQEFSDNLNTITPPKITKCSSKPYTMLKFKPDYKRLGIEGLSEDMKSLFKRRIYDIAAITHKKVSVRFNGELLQVKQFQQYIDLYIDKAKRVYEQFNERWEYAVCMSPKEEFTQVSFVNGIFTSKGGKHVDYILNQIVRKLVVYITKKKKMDVKPATIKEQLMIFVRCDIENPIFDSQTKDYMTSPSTQFGSSCEVSDKFIEKVARMGVMEVACAMTEVKETKAAKKTDGSKTKSVRGIPKLVDANDAGSAKSHECTLLLVEGDSAKAGVVSGLSKEARRIYGVYPLKGKLMNIRGASQKSISSNKEINDIKQILGLESGKIYTSKNVNTSLRYGRVLFLTDQDLDGTHIKGLCINMFDTEWASLVKLPNFIGFMNTPILKARKGNQEKLFYNDGEYEKWKHEHEHGWKIKYYKGLGTSTAKEFQEYFQHQKVVMFGCESDCRDAIDMVFNKKRANDRKTWLEQYNRNDFMDTSLEHVLYKDFIKKEMVHFSKYDCDRSIPNLMDGLKTSLRKILFSAFKRNLISEIKVAQFSGYVSEHSSYHHGEASLNGAIVGMAQDYVGSNNINLLLPNGQFGTRLQGGNDAASERYIFTVLNPLTRIIFNGKDDKVLRYLDDDGTPVEPEWYAPIVPMILVNGSKGIGTGFSTDIPSFNPIQIIEYLQCSIQNKDTSHIVFEPYYEGFKGSVKKIGTQKYLVKGNYHILNNSVHISELPVGTWTDDYKEYLEKLIEGDGKKKKDCLIKDYKDMCTDKNIDITITFNRASDIDSLIDTVDDYGCNGLEKILRLYTTQTTTNMHVFDETEKLRKFDTPNEMIDYYINIRMNVYVNRKKYLIEELNKITLKISNKARFITENLSGEIDLRRKKNEDVVALLKLRGYNQIDNDETYKYLVQMPMNSVTEENVSELLNENEKKHKELNLLISTPEKNMWLSELQELLDAYLEHKNQKHTKKKKFKVV